MIRFMMIAVLASMSLMGCGDSQPSVYRVAIDESGLADVPGACYFSGVVPSDVDKRTNAYSEQVWTLWTGESADSSYLDIQAHEYDLGDLMLNVGDITVRGGPKAWTTVKTDVQGASNTREETLTISFDGTPGSTGKGTLFIKVTNTCSGSSSCRTCEATLPFFARRIPHDVPSQGGN